ncbi:peptidase S1, partial [Mycobacterium sp. ITM-2017-0098]
MTNDPRYSPNPQQGRQPGYAGQVPTGPVGPPRSGAYEQHSGTGWDWRYATEQQRQAFRAPY